MVDVGWYRYMYGHRYRNICVVRCVIKSVDRCGNSYEEGCGRRYRSQCGNSCEKGVTTGGVTGDMNKHGMVTSVVACGM